MFCFVFSLLLLLPVLCQAEGSLDTPKLVFCSLSASEQAKCEALSERAAEDQLADEASFGSYFRSIECTQPYHSPEDCMKDMDSSVEGAPNVIIADAGDVFVGGR